MGNISEKLEYLSQTQSLIKNAIISKGVAVEDSDSFRSYVNKINNISSSDPNTLLNVTELAYQEQIELESGKVYRFVPTGNVTFVLPTIVDKLKFPQILVQLKMETVVTIDLGTTNFFNKEAPDLSKEGIYNLLFEYDLNNDVWVANVFEKGPVE